MSDEEIDLSDCPEITPEMFAKAIVRRGLPVAKAKAQVTLSIDSDVLEWFKSQGRGYQMQINQLLRAYMEWKRITNKLCLCCVLKLRASYGGITD